MSAFATNCRSRKISHDFAILRGVQLSSTRCLPYSDIAFSGGATSARLFLALLEALAAEDRLALSWFEWNGRFLAAFGAGDLRFGAHLLPEVLTFRPALLAPPRSIIKAFVGKELPLARRKHKLGSAIDARQNLINIRHG